MTYFWPADYGKDEGILQITVLNSCIIELIQRERGSWWAWLNQVKAFKTGTGPTLSQTLSC